MDRHSGLRFRQVALGGAPIAAGVLLVAGMATTPWEGAADDPLTAYYTQLAANPVAAQISTLLLAFAFLLLVPAFFGAAQLTRHRGTRLGNAGWVLGTIGYGLLAGIAAVVDIYDLAVAQQLGVAEAVALSEHIETTLPALVLVGVAAGAAALLGSILMAAALWRSREVPAWSAALLAVGTIALVVSPSALVPMTLVASALLVAWVPVSLRIIRAEDWEPGGPAVAKADRSEALVA